ncbi:MAG: MBL fold metallo-hydrolase [Oscillospiraceae bacterium]|nr:MBL fold metallo-hydrolase [Oscillospiraceae bacterium]
MARVFTLQSGSSGNCTFVGDAESGVLVDIGLSFSKSKAGLESAGMSLSQIEALLVTHEHIDHIKGLEVFCKKTDIPVYATEKTAEKLIFHAPSVEKNIHIIEKTTVYDLGRTSFSAFEVYHDAADAVGYRITTADNRKVVYSTDAGHIDDALFGSIKDADLNIIEANYDEGMLMCNAAYPFLLRQRISGGLGHISNNDCAKTVVELVKGGNRRFLLAHLSEQNNTPEIAFEAVKLALSCAGYEMGVDYELDVAPRYENSRMLIF